MKLLTELDSLDNVKDGETRKLITKTTSSGSGNTVSSVSVSGDTITYTKGVTALTAHQNAFSNVKVGSTTIAADQAGDTLELVAGSNVTLTPDATNDKVTIAATDTTYTDGTAGYTLKAKQDGNGNVIADTYVTKGTEQTITGNKTFSGDLKMDNINKAYYTATNTSNIVPNVDGLANPPWNHDLWHDHLAFLRKHSIDSQESTTDGTTWTTTTRDLKKLFYEKDIDYLSIVSASEKAFRFTLYSTDFAWSGLSWFEISTHYTEPFSNFTVKIEYSTDKTTWNKCHESTIENSAAPHFLRNGYSISANGYLRFTFTKTTNLTTGTVALSCIKGFCTRKGSQGLGIEYEYPYDWDYNANVLPIENNTKTLGNSSKKWSNVYATTFTGDLTGTASRATGDKDGNQIDTTYLKKSGGTMTGNLKFQNAKDLVWDTGTYRQRLHVTDDSTTDTPVFEFQQSTDSGSTWPTLMAIKDTGEVVADKFTGTATKAIGDKNGNDITTTYYKASNPNGYTSNTGTITGVSVNGTNVATSGVANITSVPTNILTEPRFQGSATITNRTLFHTTRANRLAFLPADQVIVEKSTDAGVTWEDASLSDEGKRSLFTGLNSGGGSIPLKNGIRSTDCMLRITFSAMKYNVPSGTTETNKYNYWSSTYVKSQERYCTLHTLYFWVNAINDRIWVKLERATGANPNNWSNIFDTSSNANRQGFTGWAGMDFITFSSGVFGGSTGQTGQFWNYRLTFRTCSNTTTSDATLFDDSKLSTSSNTSAQQIIGICGYGDNCWGASNFLMTRDHLYSWDANKNATFPAGIFTNAAKLPIANGKISGISANSTYVGSDGIGMSNPGTANDAGWLRMLGTGENDSVLELAVGDDGSGAAGSASNEEVVVRKYSTSNTVSKEIKLFDKNNNASFPGTITATTFDGTATNATNVTGTIGSNVTATTQSSGDNSTKVATTAYVDSAITALPEPMIFKGSLGTDGTITDLPAAASTNEGFTYKVITAGTYASQAAKIGDTFISDGSTWILIPSGDEPNGTVTSITLKATSPIAIDSSSAITTSGTRTLSHANSGVTAGTYKSVTVNATGHVTAGSNPTTLSGYGITDAKIDGGVITLGSNTITPITDISGKVSKTGDTMSGNLTIQKASPKLVLKASDTSDVAINIGNSNYTRDAIVASNASVNGYNLAIDSGGRTILGSGEAGANLHSTLGKNVDTETLYLISDNQIWFDSNAQTIGNRVGFQLDNSGNIVPTVADTATTNKGGVGTSTYKWANGYFTNINGVAVGDSPKFTDNDTKNTAGSTDTSSKIYLIGATSQAANPQTYSDNEVFATSGVLQAKSYSVNGGATIEFNSTDKCIEFNFV